MCGIGITYKKLQRKRFKDCDSVFKRLKLFKMCRVFG